MEAHLHALRGLLSVQLRAQRARLISSVPLGVLAPLAQLQAGLRGDGLVLHRGLSRSGGQLLQRGMGEMDARLDTMICSQQT